MYNSYRHICLKWLKSRKEVFEFVAQRWHLVKLKNVNTEKRRISLNITHNCSFLKEKKCSSAIADELTIPVSYNLKAKQLKMLLEKKLREVPSDLK